MIDFPVRVVELSFFHKLLTELSDQIEGFANESKLEFSEKIELFWHDLFVLEIQCKKVHVKESEVSPSCESGYFLVQCDFGL